MLQFLTEDAIAEKDKLRVYLRNALIHEEVLWSKRARNLWRLSDDRNTKFFYKLASHHANSNNMSSLLIEGKRVSDSKMVVEHAEAFYSKLNWKIYLITRL